MLCSQEMKRDLWVASVDLTSRPREYSEPKLYRVNVLPTTAGADIAPYGSRISEIERARMDKKYGKDIKEYDRAWIFEYDQSEVPIPPTSDRLATTAPYVVRAVKDTPLVRTVELRRLIPYENEVI